MEKYIMGQEGTAKTPVWYLAHIPEKYIFLRKDGCAGALFQTISGLKMNEQLMTVDHCWRTFSKEKWTENERVDGK